MDETPKENPMCQGARIMAEIAERLIELGNTIDRDRVSAWLVTMANLHRAHHSALWLYLAYQTGDAQMIGRSYDDHSSIGGRSRQASQQEAERAFAAIEMVDRDTATVMRQLYEAYSPEARADRYHWTDVEAGKPTAGGTGPSKAPTCR